MPEMSELRSVIDQGEQAAAAGDYASAEEALRKAALLQEADLGPIHPDLANTLNNLGVVCEAAQKPADAELCYRKAYAIALAALEPDHPFIATSRKNLTDFCEARGLPVDISSPSPAKAAEESPADVPEPKPPEPKPPETNAVSLTSESEPQVETPPLLVGSSRLLFAIVAFGTCAVVFLMLVAGRYWFGSNGPTDPPPLSASSVGGSSARQSRPFESSPVPKATTTSGTDSSRVANRRAAATSVPLLTVAEAHLCASLSTDGLNAATDWQCSRPRLPVGPGPLFFYTRVKSAGDTTIQHRWYRGDQLHQMVKLRIRANLTRGYRTYSRSTFDNRGAGDWRVELRTEDGVLLREERFAVR